MHSFRPGTLDSAQHGILRNKVCGLSPLNAHEKVIQAHNVMREKVNITQLVPRLVTDTAEAHARIQYRPSIGPCIQTLSCQTTQFIITLHLNDAQYGACKLPCECADLAVAPALVLGKPCISLHQSGRCDLDMPANL